MSLLAALIARGVLIDPDSTAECAGTAVVAGEVDDE